MRLAIHLLMCQFLRRATTAFTAQCPAFILPNARLRKVEIASCMHQKQIRKVSTPIRERRSSMPSTKYSRSRRPGHDADARLEVESHIATIKSYNLAGISAHGGESDEIIIQLGDEPNLTAITGETGSGKSVLIARVADLATGGKASPSMVPPPPEGRESEGSQASVEMVINLSEPQLSRVEEVCRKVGIDPSLLDQQQNGVATLVLKRTISLQHSPRASKPRLKSWCHINGHSVTLKSLRAIAAPLLTIVDAAAAASALSRPNSRMSVIDTGVPLPIKSAALEAKVAYRRERRYREELERELKSRVLPSSYSPDGDEESLALLQHWVDELDAFEERMNSFRDSAVSNANLDADVSRNEAPVEDAINMFEASSWFDLVADDETQSRNLVESDAVSSFYSNLLSFREFVNQLNTKLQAAQSACESLSSLSSPDSAVTALERARNFLFDATVDNGVDALSLAAEETHERLNAVEDALSLCVQSLEDTNKGLISTLQRSLDSICVSLEDIDALISDWNTIARKHNISPWLLPSCHRTLRSELDGNVEARTLLPMALKKEEEALSEFERTCRDLTDARRRVAQELSLSVTKRLPALGMERSLFHARCSIHHQCTDGVAYGNGSGLGVDAVDFMLLHRQNGDDSSSNLTEVSAGDTDDNGVTDRFRGGKLEAIGSAGEKARIILAIETALPGSVGVLCGPDGSLQNSNDFSSQIDDVFQEIPSVAVLYDEIDAHVGGRAAVALAKLLVDQTRPQARIGAENEGGARGRGQVIAITHSPSVAAIADRHIVVCRRSVGSADANQKQNRVHVSLVEGSCRREELGRMCGGDLARDEAVLFAGALLRDGELQKDTLKGQGFD